MSKMNTAAAETQPDQPQKSRRKKIEVADESVTFFQYIREWIDALVIAFVVAMFIRTFVMELFKIPSGSMSPTLLGDIVSEGTAVGQDGESHQFLLIAANEQFSSFQVFSKRSDGFYDYEGRKDRYQLTSSQQMLMNRLKREEHRILVNKFAYWFKTPKVGDIAIFRVPFTLDPPPARSVEEYQSHPPYNRNQNVYVKRVVATENQRLEIGDDEHLYANGEKITKPAVIANNRYFTPFSAPSYDVTIPEKHVAMFGDNSDNSLDSRFWGPLPEENLRGKAVLTYWPLGKSKFLTPKQ